MHEATLVLHDVDLALIFLMFVLSGSSSPAYLVDLYEANSTLLLRPPLTYEKEKIGVRMTDVSAIPRTLTSIWCRIANQLSVRLNRGVFVFM